MFNVADYFKKFTRIAEDSTSVNDAINKAFFEVCGTAGVVFEVKKGVIYIQGSSTLKALMFMHKARVLEHIRQDLPKSKIMDIR